MAEEHHHHLFHNKNEEPVLETTDVYKENVVDDAGVQHEVKHAKHREHVGEAAAGVAAALALHEKHAAASNPEHARRHKLGEKLAGAAGLGIGGAAFHERHEEKKEEEAEGKHRKHFF